MSFRTAVLALPLALVLAASFASAQTEAPTTHPDTAHAMNSLFEKSKQENKGLMFHVQGQQIAGIVVDVGSDFVTVKNREYNIIVIRKDRIDAVAGN